MFPPYHQRRGAFRFSQLPALKPDYPFPRTTHRAWFARGLTFLSSVEILDAPRSAADPALRSPGRGRGHVFVLDPKGGVIRDVVLGEDTMYHPGGIDFDGDHVWVSVAEYRAGGRSIVYTIDPESFEVRERFRVDDHIGWILRDPGLDLVFGGSWGSRHLHTWDTEARLVASWQNPAHFVDYQDAQLLGPVLLLCSEFPCCRSLAVQLSNWGDWPSWIRSGSELCGISPSTNSAPPGTSLPATPLPSPQMNPGF